MLSQVWKLWVMLLTLKTRIRKLKSRGETGNLSCIKAEICGSNKNTQTSDSGNMFLKLFLQLSLWPSVVGGGEANSQELISFFLGILPAMLDVAVRYLVEPWASGPLMELQTETEMITHFHSTMHCNSPERNTFELLSVVLHKHFHPSSNRGWLEATDHGLEDFLQASVVYWIQIPHSSTWSVCFNSKMGAFSATQISLSRLSPGDL